MRVPSRLKGPCRQNEVMHSCETTAQVLSNEPKTRTLGENLTSVKFVESLVTEK